MHETLMKRGTAFPPRDGRRDVPHGAGNGPRAKEAYRRTGCHRMGTYERGTSNEGPESGSCRESAAAGAAYTVSGKRRRGGVDREIRLRTGRRVMLSSAGLEREAAASAPVTPAQLRQVMENVTRSSLHSAAESLKHGYVTSSGGCRVGSAARRRSRTARSAVSANFRPCASAWPGSIRASQSRF